MFLNEADFLIDKLMRKYSVDTFSELAPYLHTTQQVVSGWKARNAIKVIQKKCRELGIYDEIFGDINIQNIKKVKGHNTQSGDIVSSEKQNELDDATYSLILEKYNKIKANEEDLMKFRMYIMSYKVN